MPVVRKVPRILMKTTSRFPNPANCQQTPLATDNPRAPRCLRLAALLDSERAARTDRTRAGRMKDELVAVLSHELRNPLNALDAGPGADGVRRDRGPPARHGLRLPGARAQAPRCDPSDCYGRGSGGPHRLRKPPCRPQPGRGLTAGTVLRNACALPKTGRFSSTSPATQPMHTRVKRGAPSRGELDPAAGPARNCRRAQCFISDPEWERGDDNALYPEEKSTKRKAVSGCFCCFSKSCRCCPNW